MPDIPPKIHKNKQNLYLSQEAGTNETLTAPSVGEVKQIIMKIFLTNAGSASRTSTM